MDALLVQSIASLPTALAALVAVGLPMLLAMGVGLVILSVFTPQELALNADVGRAKFSFIVEIYAVVAALALVGAWDIYQTTRDTLQKETSALYMLAHATDSYALPHQGAAREEMRGALRGYGAAVVEQDWPKMQAGAPGSASDATFTRLSRAFMLPEPETQAQQAIAQNTAQWLLQIAEARTARLSVGTRTLTMLVWFLVLTASVSVLLFQWFIGSAHLALHYTMGAVIALIVGVVLLVSMKLAFPVVGDSALLSPRPFLELMRLP
jgi:hypothetical protein